MKTTIAMLGGRVAVAILFAMGATVARADNLCGGTLYPLPFTDIGGVGAAFCTGILENYVVGITKGTTATTFGPNDTVTRTQMTTFLARTLNQALARNSRRAGLGQWWTPLTLDPSQLIAPGVTARACISDGTYLWVAQGGFISQYEPDSGGLLTIRTVASGVTELLAANGKIYGVSVADNPGKLYAFDSAAPAGAAPIAATNLGASPNGLAFDGVRLWVANAGGGVSIITPQAATPYPTTVVTTGIGLTEGLLFDGSNIWVADTDANALLKLGATGNVLQSVPVGAYPMHPVFDGVNIWVADKTDSSVTVIQASTGAVVDTITSDPTNKLSQPQSVAFDGERILVMNRGNDSVTFFNPTTLAVLRNIPTGAGTKPTRACSDWTKFFVLLSPSIARF